MTAGIIPVSSRPRSQQTHQKVLDSVNALLRDVGFSKISIERLAEHSGVSTATIYKHWPSKNAAIAEAFGQVAERSIVISTKGSPLENLVDSAVNSLSFHSIASGRVFFQLLAACSMEPHGAAYFQEYYLGPRRESLKPLFQAAIDSGDLHPTIDIDMANDVLFGPAVFRLMRDAEVITAPMLRETISWSVRGLLNRPD